MGEGARGEGIENNHLQPTPWDFWNSVGQQTQQAAFLISWQNVKVNLSADVRFPVDTKFKEILLVVLQLSAFDLICVC